MNKKTPSPRRRRASLAFSAVTFGLSVAVLALPPGKPAAMPVRPVGPPPPPVRGALATPPFTALGKDSVAAPVLADLRKAAAGQEATGTGDASPAPARPEPKATTDSGEGSDIYRRAVDAVAWIIAGGKGGTQSQGTGVLIDAQRGYVLTAYHVIGSHDALGAVFPARDGGGEIIPNRQFYLDEFRRLCIPCVVVAKDSTRDLALLRLHTPPHGRKGIALAATGAMPGQWLCLIGNAPIHNALWRFGSGNVRQVYEASYRTQSAQDIRAKIVETTVPVNPGDSGGPLLDRTGELVGINSSYCPDVNQVQQGIDLSDIRGFLRGAGAGGEAAGKE